jgi:hypothetical protein
VRRTEECQFPVSVVMERRLAHHGPWSYPRWTAVGVVAGEAIGTGMNHRRVRLDDDGAEQVLWSGLRLALHRDAAESYWYNLVGKQPSLFIACRADPDGELTPWVVTADYDEAGAYMEADDTVFALPMPPEIHRWLEEYVMANYHPVPPTKRQRKRWTEDTAHETRRGSAN